jgi:hypothetical protein
MSQHRYSRYLDGVDLMRSLEETPARIAAIVRGWPAAAFERRHAPGKWTARQVLTHLAQAELVFANRLRFGVAEDGYVIQPFDQDRWMAAEPHADGRAALDAYLAVRGLNLAFIRRLTPAQRARRLRHPEAGEVDVDWVITYFAGHERNHLPQFEAIRTSA